MNNDNIVYRKLISTDFDRLLHYLHYLSNETKGRFGPHPFDETSVIDFYKADDVTGYIAEEKLSHSIIAYAIIRKGILYFEKERLLDYKYFDIDKDCCTYAPSVADNWQGKGIGKLLFNCILNDCKKESIKKIILWGGVQSSNERAINFYRKLGFIKIGLFEYNGSNEDMILEIE
jgi:diamine N-acetyltransferase